MKLLNNERITLQILRFAPAIFLILLSISTTYYISYEHSLEVKNEKTEIKEKFIQENKDLIKNNVDNAISYINNEYIDGLDDIKENVKNRINNAHIIMNSIYTKYKDTKSKEEITELIKDVLSDIRFSKNRGYFFIYERSGKNILNAEFRELEGKNLWNFKDSKGTLILQDMYKILDAKDETFYNWYWKESKESTKVSEKLGFFKKFEPYDWFIGTGEYLESYNKEIEEKVLNNLKKIKYEKNKYIFIIDKNATIKLSKNNLLDGKNLLKDKEFINIKDTYKKLVSSDLNSTYYQYKTDFYKSEVEKVSFFKRIKQNGWVVGGGFDLEKVNNLIKINYEKVDKQEKEYIRKLIMVSIIITNLLLIISYFFSKYIERVFINYKKDVREKNERLIKAQEISKLGEWEIDLNSMEINLSDNIKNMFGLNNTKLSIDYVKEIIHKDDLNNYETLMTNCIKNEIKLFTNFRIIRPNDNTIRYFICRGERIDKNTIIGTVQDITEQKLIQLENEKKEAIIYQQSKMAAMGEMIGNIAHQWKQPLSIISMSNGLLKINQEDNTFSTYEEINNAYEHIDDAVAHLSTTIDDFSNFFNPDKNEKKKCKINNVLNKTLKLVSSYIKSKDIEIITEMEDLDVISIENQLIQIIINILNNAKDAFEKKDINKKLIFISVKEEKNKVIIQICDNAGGIPDNIINKIFNSYFTTKKESGGTGIGLYMSQEIATKLLDTSISVENKEFIYKNESYKGACFKLPLCSKL